MSEESNQVEALLFSSGRAMGVEDIMTIMNLDRRAVKKAIKELKEYYDAAGSGLMLSEEGDSWKLSIKEKYVSLVIKIIADTEMSKQVLETLSVIAWKSPVLQSEVVHIRTSNAYEHIKELVEAGFINKEREGRSYRIRISEKFFDYFDVPGDKGIKEAFKEVKIPEKKDPQLLGALEVVSVEESDKKTEELNNEITELKKEIPPIDENFLDKISSQIEGISSRNDDLEKDALFKRNEDEEHDEAGESGEEIEGEPSKETPEETSEENTESPDEYVEGTEKYSKHVENPEEISNETETNVSEVLNESEQTKEESEESDELEKPEEFDETNEEDDSDDLDDSEESDKDDNLDEKKKDVLS